MFCHPGLPGAFGHFFVGSFPGTALEHRVVGDAGFQAGVGFSGPDQSGFLQLRGKKTFGWSPKHAEQMKRYQETIADRALRWTLLTLDMDVDGPLPVLRTPAGVRAAVARLHGCNEQVGHSPSSVLVIFNAELVKKQKKKTKHD